MCRKEAHRFVTGLLMAIYKLPNSIALCYCHKVVVMIVFAQAWNFFRYLICCSSCRNPLWILFTQWDFLTLDGHSLYIHAVRSFKFIHCIDYVILLQLPHIFGTCLNWCSEFSCILRVKSHFINTHFYVCSFYIPYANWVWSDCQHTSEIWLTGCFPLVYCLFWRASRGAFWFSLSSCLLLCLWAVSWLTCQAT